MGALAAVIDFSGYYTLTRLFSFFAEYYIITNLLTAGVATTFSFFCNRHFTFQDHRPIEVGQYMQYILVYGSGVVLQSLVLGGFVEFAGVRDVVAKVFAILIVAFLWNFPLGKFWVFRHTS